jgi:hypothetical protein
MGPGMFMIQEVPPGKVVDLHKLGGVRFTVYNKADEPHDFNLTCRKPTQAGLVEWEKGYEEIPDAAWCRLEEPTFTIPAKGEKQVGLIIEIPDAPENYNRKFMLGVVLKTGLDPAFGVGLAVTCRVEIETAVNDHLGANPGAALATVPGTIALSGKPGATVSGPVRLRNNTAGRLAASVERLSVVETDPTRQARYFASGLQPQIEPWLAPQMAAFALESGGENRLLFSGTIPASAEVGKKYEELAFIRAKAADGKELMTFVRLHCQVEATEPAKAEPPAKPTTPAPEKPTKP